MIQVAKRSFTVKDYYKMAEVGILTSDDRVELIKGEIVKMSPITSPHSGTINFLYRKLIKLLGETATVTSQNPLRISDISELEPDILVAKFRKDDYRSRHLRPTDVYCVIEVVKSSLYFDRSSKKELYAEAGIPEYWVVNIRKKKN